MSKVSRAKTSSNGSSIRHHSPARKPAMLSPTLPPWVDELFPNMPDRMLSPTLPPVFDSMENKQVPPRREADDLDELQLHQPVPRRAGNSKFSKVIKASENGLSNVPTPAGAASLPAKPTRRRSLIVSMKLPQELHSRLASNGMEKTDKLLAKDHGGVGLGIKGEVKEKRKSMGSASSAPAKRPRVARTYSSSSDDEGDIPLKAAAAVASNRIKRSPLPATPPPTSSGTPKTKALQPSATILRAPQDDSASREDASGNSTPKVNGSSSTPKLSRSTDERDRAAKKQEIRALNDKKFKWLKLAKDLKHKSDRADGEGKHDLGLVLAMDATLAFIVGFELGDKAELKARCYIEPELWYSMIPFLRMVIRRFEASKDGKHMITLVYFMRGIIYTRLAWAWEQISQQLQRDSKSGEPDTRQTEKLVEASTKYLAMHEGATTDLRRALHDLSPELIQREFPETWERRSKTLLLGEGKKGSSLGLMPQSDAYFLPLSAFTTIQEVAAFCYQMTSEWAAKNRVPFESCLVEGP